MKILKNYHSEYHTAKYIQSLNNIQSFLNTMIERYLSSFHYEFICYRKFLASDISYRVILFNIYFYIRLRHFVKYMLINFTLIMAKNIEFFSLRVRYLIFQTNSSFAHYSSYLVAYNQWKYGITFISRLQSMIVWHYV